MRPSGQLVLPVLALTAGCGWIGPTVSQTDAIQRATADALGGQPELEVLEARVDGATAELITRAGAERRRDGRPGPGQDGAAMVWWVTVRGHVRFAGMAPAGGGARSIDEADERACFYAARTGQPLGGWVRLRPAPP